MQTTAKAYASFLRQRNDNRRLYQTLHDGYYPFQSGHLIANSANAIELFVNSKLLVPSPRCWEHLAPSMGAIRQAYLNLLELFRYFSTELGCSTTLDGDVAIPTQIVSFERVQSVADEAGNRRDVGYRERIISQPVSQPDEAPTNTIPLILANLLSENAIRDSNTRRKRINGTFKQNDSELFESDAYKFIRTLTLEEYVRLCSIYTGLPIDMDEARAKGVARGDSPVNPHKVFSIPQSLELAEKAGCDPIFAEASRYMSKRGVRDVITNKMTFFTFPVPENVWRISPGYMGLGMSRKVYWPFVRPPSAESTNAERIAYIKTKAVEGVGEAEAAFVYDNFIANATVENEEPESMKSLAEKLKRQIDQARSKYTNVIEADNAVRQLQIDALDEFALHFSPDGVNTPDAIKNIARWMHNYVSTAPDESFCMPSKKLTKNLTRLGDEITTYLILFETLFDVNTEHKPGLGLVLKQMFVYLNEEFNPHSLFMGPAEAGKSFILKVVMKCLIEGTFINTTYITPKSQVTSGNKLQYMLRFFEDMTPSFLGIGANEHKPGETANTDMDAITNAWLTSNFLSASVADMPGGRASMTTVDIRNECSTVISACSNATKARLPHAKATRFDVQVWQNKHRAEGGGLIVKATKTRHPLQQAMMDLVVTKFRRNQAFCAVIFQMIYVGILPQIDMTVANLIIAQTLTEAKSIGLDGVDDIRNAHRVAMLVKVLVVWDAIGLLWDSPDTPFKKSETKYEPHDISHFLLVRHYLRANVEHAVLAIGMLSSQFENNIIHSITDDLMATYFRPIAIEHKEKAKKKKMGATAASAAQTATTRITADADLEPPPPTPDPATVTKKPPTAQQATIEETIQASEVGKPREDENYFIAPFDDTVVGLGRSTKYMDGNSERIKFLVKKQLVTMAHKPLKEDMLSVYEALLNKPVIDKTYKPAAGREHEPPRMIPALKFESGNMYLSKDLVRDNRANALMDCLSRVVNHKYATDAEYLYGVARPNCPFLFETIKVAPKIVNKRDTRKRIEAIDPNYYERNLVNITENYVLGLAMLKMRKPIGMTSKTFETKARKAFRGAFSRYPRLVIDMDLNRYADEAYFIRERLLAREMDYLPESDPNELRRRLVDAAEQEQRKLIKYPEDLPHYMPIRLMNKQQLDVAQNPEKYSLSRFLAKDRRKLERLVAQHQQPANFDPTDETGMGEDDNDDVDPSQNGKDEMSVEPDISTSEPDNEEDLGYAGGAAGTTTSTSTSAPTSTDRAVIDFGPPPDEDDEELLRTQALIQEEIEEDASRMGD